MKLNIGIVVCLLLTACASAFGVKQLPPDVVGTLADLRVPPQGICARAEAQGRTVNGVAVRTCIQTGSPGTLNDDPPTAYVVSRITGWTFEDSNPGAWQLTITDERGREVYKSILERRVPDVGVCTSTGCLKNGVSAIRVPELWSPGKYTFRYVCAFDTSAVATITFTLAEARAASR